MTHTITTNVDDAIRETLRTSATKRNLPMGKMLRVILERALVDGDESLTALLQDAGKVYLRSTQVRSKRSATASVSRQVTQSHNPDRFLRSSVPQARNGKFTRQPERTKAEMQADLRQAVLNTR